ncbi:hypothetical protein [Deinococcus navajonensis]|uniref:Lipoprotein n=1 Tax=Deinococcus navajonensis TaxID=309884 RepID=A0ABV8XHL1_9DEIO
MRSMTRLLLSVLPLLTGCSYFLQPPPPSFEVKGTQIAYDGPITSAFLMQLLEAVTPETTELMIRSSGGDGHAAYRIAEVIQNHRLKVTVTGPCISACSMLFPAGQKKTVLPGGYLGYHWNNQTRTETTAERLRIGEASAFQVALEREVEDSFNASVGVRQALYDDAWLLVQARLNQHPVARWLSALRGDPIPVWIPTPEELACYGLHVDEFWFPQAGDLQQLPFRFRIGPDLFTSRDLRTVPKGTSTCVGTGMMPSRG